MGSTGNYQRDITSDRFDSIIRKLIETQDELFRCDDTEKKKQLKEQIEALRDMIILTQLEGCDGNPREYSLCPSLQEFLFNCPVEIAEKLQKIKDAYYCDLPF